MIKYQKGDVITAFLNREIDVFAHGCNCQRVMGSGVAAQVRERLPELYEVYMKPATLYLGTWSGQVWTEDDQEYYGFNLMTQDRYGTSKRYVNYGAIASAFFGIADELSYNGIDRAKIGIPRIGAGLAGGDWEVISEIIDHIVTRDFNHELFVYDI